MAPGGITGSDCGIISKNVLALYAEQPGGVVVVVAAAVLKLEAASPSGAGEGIESVFSARPSDPLSGNKINPSELDSL